MTTQTKRKMKLDLEGVLILIVVMSMVVLGVLLVRNAFLQEKLKHQTLEEENVVFITSNLSGDFERLKTTIWIDCEYTIINIGINNETIEFCEWFKQHK